MRNELGELGGAGHYWGDDAYRGWIGQRRCMKKDELKNVLKLLAAGEKKINLKEKEFRTFLREQNG